MARARNRPNLLPIPPHESVGTLEENLELVVQGVFRTPDTFVIRQHHLIEVKRIYHREVPDLRDVFSYLRLHRHPPFPPRRAQHEQKALLAVSVTPRCDFRIKLLGNNKLRGKTLVDSSPIQPPPVPPLIEKTGRRGLPLWALPLVSSRGHRRGHRRGCGCPRHHHRG